MTRITLATLAGMSALTLTGLLAQPPDKNDAKTDPKNDPYIGFEYDYRYNFGVLVLKDPNGKRVKKQLTFDTLGQTNGMLVRLDGKDTEFGTKPGKVLSEGEENQSPSKTVWALGKVELAQIIEIVPGKTGKLDTLLIRYIFDNKDNKPHKVGIRTMIDTAIGVPDNDGVPFRYAGGKELITTFKDFKDDAVPAWVEALEFPNEEEPGTIAVLTLKVKAGLEPPSRASITRWPGAAPARWEIPLETFDPPGAGARKDSCLVLYWKEAELQPGKKRELGYGFGTAAKPTDDTPIHISMPPVVKRPSTCCRGDVSVQHAQCALKAALKMIPAEPLMDVNRDGKVTEADVADIVKEAVSLVTVGETKNPPDAALTISLAKMQAAAGDEIEAAINLEGADRLGCLQLALHYDAAVLELKGVARGPLLPEHAILDHAVGTPGRLGLGFVSGVNDKKTGLTRISSDGTLFKVRFLVIGQAGQKSPLTPQRLQAWQPDNEEITVRGDAGEVTIPTGAAALFPWNLVFLGAGGFFLLLTGGMRVRRRRGPASFD